MEKKICYDVEEVQGVQLEISDKAQSQIDYLLRKFPNTEWSGMMVWDIVEGSLKSPTDLKLIVEYVLLMDIGSAAYTEYDNNAQLMLDLYDEYPDAMTKRIGHIHSHHNMKAYFSSTDDQELHDNVDKHVAYLSMIVSKSSSYAAKMAKLVEQSSTYTIKDFDDEEISSTSTEKIMLVYDIDIAQEEYEANSLIDARLAKVREYSEERMKTTHKTYDYYGGRKPGQYGYQHDMFEHYNEVQRGADEDGFVSCSMYFNIPTVTINSLLKTLLGIEETGILSVEVKAMDLIKSSSLTDEMMDDFDIRITDAVQMMYIENDAGMTSMLLESGVFSYRVTQKLVDMAEKTMPDGETKALTLQTLNFLLADSFWLSD